MTGGADIFEQLIERGHEIADSLRELHVRPPDETLPLDRDEVRRRTDAYLEWLTACRSAMGTDQGRHFYQLYSGSSTYDRYSMRSFITEPYATSQETLHSSARYGSPGKVKRWSHAFKLSFEPGFNRQMNVLAEHRAAHRVTPTRLAESKPKETPGTRVIFHSAVRKAIGTRLKDGHYDDAVLRASSALIAAVQDRAGIRIAEKQSPMSFMGAVLSAKAPVLRVRDHSQEQEGYMHLFMGAVGALRNVTAHLQSDEDGFLEHEAIQWLAFISALYGVLDFCELVDAEDRETP